MPIGWNSIAVQLAVFFGVLRRRPNGLTPFNLFLHGLPGTNKTEGVQAITHLLNYKFGLVDCGTFDDISELAGAMDMHANRELGKAQMTGSDLLQSEILGLDEMLNTRQHVLQQMRLFLQGKLTLLGATQDMAIRAMIATGNLTSDMRSGMANELDTPTADRFLMVVQVPDASEMTQDEAMAILMGQPHDGFEREFTAALRIIEGGLENGLNQYLPIASRFVYALMHALPKDSAFAFQFRRGKALAQFTVATMVLCAAQPQRDFIETLKVMVRDTLSYQKLSGVELNETEFEHAFLAASVVFESDINTESEIALERNLAKKVKIALSNLSNISPVTAIEVFVSLPQASGDTAIILALKQAAAMGALPLSGELLRLIQGLIVKFVGSITLSPQTLAKLAELSETDAYLYQLCEGNFAEYQVLKHQIDEYIQMWR